VTCEEVSVNGAVMIAVDPHKASNTAAVLDPVSKTLIESARFTNTADGYARLTGFAGRWEQRRWAVEGCFGAGRSLAQRLVADGEAVLDVPAKLAARVQVYSQGHGRKTDKDDAVSVGLAALDGTGVRPVTADGDLVSLRLLCDRREELTAQRTQAVCRLHRLLAELIPGGMRRELSAGKAQALLAQIQPGDDVTRIRVQIARDHLADIRALDSRLKYIHSQIAALVTANGTTLTALYPSSAGRHYYERKRKEGKTPKEALRCLKRRLSDLACYQMLADQRSTIEGCGSPTTPPPTRSTSTSPESRSHRAGPPSRRPCLPAATASSRSTGRTAVWSASRSSTRPVIFTMTFSKLPSPNNPAAS
jgi:hypothetical protein